MNNLMFEISNFTGSVLNGWYDDKVVVGYEHLMELKELYEKTIESEDLFLDDKFQLELMYENADKAFMLRYEFYEVRDVSLGTVFQTKTFSEFMTTNELW